MFIIPSLPSFEIENISVEKPLDPFIFTRSWISLMGTGTSLPLAKNNWTLDTLTEFTPSTYITLAQRKEHLQQQQQQHSLNQTKRNKKNKNKNKNRPFVKEFAQNKEKVCSEDEFDAMLKVEITRQDEKENYFDEY